LSISIGAAAADRIGRETSRDRIRLQWYSPIRRCRAAEQELEVARALGGEPPDLAFTMTNRQWLVAAAAVLGIAVAAAELRAQTRLMPLGDSITEAETGHASYRYWLWHRLMGGGYPVDLVGSMTGVYGGPPLYSDFDPDHEGHWGWRADEILAEIVGWATAAQPEVVLVHLGHNDLWQGQGVETTIDELEAIVLAIRSVNPRVTVLLAEVIPSTLPALDEIPALNAEIVLLAALLDSPVSRVIAVDQWTGFDPVVDTYDGVHPSESGEQKLAQRWFEVLEVLLEPTGLVFRDGFESGDFGQWAGRTSAAGG
jgi:hypothetical protein